MSRGTTLSYSMNSLILPFTRIIFCTTPETFIHQTSLSSVTGIPGISYTRIAVLKQNHQQTLQTFSSKATFRTRHPGKPFSPRAFLSFGAQYVLLFLITFFIFVILTKGAIFVKTRFFLLAIYMLKRMYFAHSPCASGCNAAVSNP